MAKNAKRKQGPPRISGPGTIVSLRCHQRFVAAVDRWRKRQEDKPSRSAAIVQLAEKGLTAVGPMKRTSPKSAAKAAELAGEEIDRMTDQSASVEEQAIRKRRLLKGPREFREIRDAHPRKPAT
jgi:hypothetical protein